jgi:hypothetical protein
MSTSRRSNVANVSRLLRPVFGTNERLRRRLWLQFFSVQVQLAKSELPDHRVMYCTVMEVWQINSLSDVSLFYCGYICRQ